ncbi:MAG: hypothetical protein IKX31_06030 [Muribaculaceae bacterium]|nr:hypothetical protein [Muribaculaceae bacterium]
MASIIRKLLLLLMVAMIGLSPDICAQNRDVTRHKPSTGQSSTSTNRGKQQTTKKNQSNSSSSRHRSTPSSQRSSTSSGRKGTGSNARSATAPISLQRYSVKPDYKLRDGSKCYAFYVDFTVRNRSGKGTSICIYAFKGDNNTKILNCKGEPLYVSFYFVPQTNVAQTSRAELLLTHYDLENSVNWDPDKDGLSFDLIFLDEYGNIIGALEDLDY